MTDSFLSTILPLNESQPPVTDKTQLLNRLQQVYQHSLYKITQQPSQSNVIQSFQHYYQQLRDLITQHSATPQYAPSCINTSRTISISNQPNSQQQLDPAIQQQQSDYLFLKNAWQSKYEPIQGYDSEDHIDRINKVVAMVRMRTNYMIKKECYLHEKEESLNSYIFQNPFFMKVKEELQRMTMRNEELSQRCHFHSETIARLQSEKSVILQNFTNMKKKYQQMENSFIEISKKNICLQQDSLTLKFQNSKNKLNSMRQSTDFMGVADLRRSTSFSRFPQEAKTTERSTQPSQGTIKPSLPLQNVFIDISLNLNSNREQKETKTTNDRYMNNDSENEENASVNGGRDRVNSQSQNLQVLALCRSERLINEESPMRLKYIKNHDNNSARRALLSSARSVDLVEKTSLNKPKFQRTKPNNQNLLKSVKKDDSVVIDTKAEKASIVKKHSILSNGIGSSKAFRDIQEQIFQREVN